MILIIENMNENLDLTKILEGCPTGTKFYSNVYGKVDFSRIISDDYGKCSIELMGYNKDTYSISAVYCEKDGTFSYDYEGECILFPSKEQRDWSKFVRFWDKPKVEKFDLKTLQPFDKVLVRNDSLGSWRCDLLSHFNEFSGDPLFISAQYWRECIPYNEDTKYLLGTKCDAPEYYKWWEK